MRSRRVRAVGCAALALSFSLAGAAAFAQESPEEIARRELIAEAERAADGADHARAVELATRAARIRSTPSIQYFLAVEHRILEHPVEALGYASACARSAELDPALRNRDAILTECRQIAAAMEARVGRVELRVLPPVPEGITVRVGATSLDAALWGVPVPVAPGSAVVEASAPGYAPLRREVQVEAGQVARIEVSLERLPAPPPAVAPAPPAAPPVSRRPPTPAVPPRGPGAGPWIVAGVGVASFALAGVFYALASSAQGERDAACDATSCEAIAGSHDARYADNLLATNVALGVGAAAVVGGAVWWLLARPRRESPRAAVGLHVATAPGAVGFGLRGAW